MSIPFDGRTKPENPGIHQIVRMSGPLYVKSRKSNARNVPIKHLNLCRMVLLLDISMLKRIALLESILCFKMRLAGFLQWISISKIGSKMPRQYWQLARNGTSRLHLSVLVRGMVGISGSFFSNRLKLSLQGNLDAPY